MSSIRGKIALIYYLLAGVAVGFALFAYGDLRYLEQRITEGGVVSAFREAVLEMRRHEKNYLLYRDAAELDAAMAFAGTARQRLVMRGAFEELASAEQLGILARGRASSIWNMARGVV